MDTNFWHQRWETNQIGFHEPEVNPLLVRYFKELALEKGRRIFVPLCGKTLDIGWLRSQGYRVAGAELSELAIKQLFAELGIEPDITNVGLLKHYSADGIDLFVGDIFDLTHELLGSVDAVFDRAALVALPDSARDRYTKHITEITQHAPQLLITYEYDQTLRQGPPFSVSSEEVRQHYASRYQISLLSTEEVVGGMRGGIPAKESVWLLK